MAAVAAEVVVVGHLAWHPNSENRPLCDQSPVVSHKRHEVPHHIDDRSQELVHAAPLDNEHTAARQQLQLQLEYDTYGTSSQIRKNPHQCHTRHEDDHNKQHIGEFLE